MTIRRRGRAVALALVVVAVGGYAIHRARRGLPPMQDELPAFVAPGPGPRAGTQRLLGVEVGRTRVAEAQALLQRAGLECSDTSMRALMALARQEKEREIEAARASGKGVDAVSGASMVRRRSPKEKNPQVRLSCEGVASDRLGDRARPPSRGRLLFVFDSGRHPLRHVSFERTFPAAAEDRALEDLTSSRSAMIARLGAPASGAAARALPWLTPVGSEWRFADLRARVGAINYGPRGIVVSEIVEVPWPVRTD